MPETDLALIEQRIYTIRGVRVILDSNLAALYGVPTKRLNEQYRRNRKRFPEDFAFQLTAEEANSLRSQFATSSSHGGRRYRPYAFTEHGALMAANILNSPRAVQMSIFVVRAFAKMRETLLGTRELAKETCCAGERAHRPIGRAWGGDRAGSARSHANLESATFTTRAAGA